MAELPNPLARVQQGQSWIDGLFAQQANRTAGAALAQGNYGAAANTLFRSGNLSAGQGVRDQGVADQTRQRTLEAEGRARQLATTQQLVRATRAVRDAGGDVAAEIQRIEPAILAMGTNPIEWNQIKASVLANPRILDDIASTVDREIEVINLGEGNALAIDKANGDEVARYSAPRRPQRVVVGNDYVEVGDDGRVRPLYQGGREPEYRSVRNSDGTETIVALGGRPGGVIAGGGGSGGAGGFTNRDEVLSFVAPLVGDFRPTSGPRSREEQDALIARGATRAYNSAHVNGLGQDIVPSAPIEEWEAIADRLRATGQFERVLVETGRGRNQGTGAHIHLEPRVAGGGQTAAPVAGGGGGGGAQVVAQGRNNGLSPAEARQEARDQRADMSAQSALRREFNSRPEVRAFREVESAYNNVRSAAENPSAAGDLSMIFAYMKMLDPGSVVREQEFANAQNAAGVPDRIRNLYNRTLNGQRLNTNQRRDFVNQAERLYGNQRDRFSRIEEEYRREAEANGYDPERIAPRQPTPNQQPRRLRFTPTQQQTEASQRITANLRNGVTPPRGTRANPILINPQDPRASYGNVPRGSYFITPDGQVRGPKP